MFSRRRVIGLISLAALSVGMHGAAFAQAKDEFGSAELIAAAKKEGKLTLYTSNWTENEQPMVAKFNERFPEITVEIVRGTAAAMLTRIQSEAAANKLQADIIDLADRTSAGMVADLAADYVPPNASDYEAADVVQGKLWPRVSWGWVIGYNSALVQNPPKTWKAVVSGDFAGGGLGYLAQAPSGSAFTLAMFQRQVLGEDSWKKIGAQKPLLFASSPQLTSSLTRGEIKVGPVLTNAVKLAAKDGAPIAMILPPEGVPVAIGAGGIAKTAKNMNAAKLYMNWSLSREGQTQMVQSEGLFSVLKGAPVPGSVDSGTVKLWRPNPDEFANFVKSWPAEFAKQVGGQ